MSMKRVTAIITVLLAAVIGINAQKPVELVNPFIGTTNFGTTNPGAVTPNGMMSVVPFNVMGSDLNVFDKDSRWWSAPYEYNNKFFTGYAHVALSGVGCPEASSLLVMPTSGELDVNYFNYGTEYTDEKASPGYYSNRLAKYLGSSHIYGAVSRCAAARVDTRAGICIRGRQCETNTKKQNKTFP